jgi:protein-S-isoprenylcysteine O-methyltransferase Ste14
MRAVPIGHRTGSDHVSDFRQTLFHYRGYTPIPFLLVMVLFAEPTGWTMAIGTAVALLGESLRFWGVAYAGSLTRVTGSVGAPEIIVSGPFARTRNPLYLGNILLYTGIGIIANALTPWLVLAALVYFVFQYLSIVSLEEEFLEKEFGAAYQEYKASVPRFVPRLSAFAHPAKEGQKPRWRDALRSERRTLQAIGLVLVLLVVLWLWR